MSAHGSLQVRVDGGDGESAVLSLHGELDLASSRVLQDVLDPLIARRRPSLMTLVLDVAEVTLADVAGLTPVLHVRAVLARRGGSVQLRHASRLLRRLVAVLGLDGELLEDAEPEDAEPEDAATEPPRPEASAPQAQHRAAQ